MNERYKNNRFFITEEEQELLKIYPILIAGCGTGSIIAECILRFGFENITLVDQELVKLTDLSTEQYNEEDINKSKAEVLKRRLLLINKNAKVSTYNHPLEENELKRIIEQCNFVVNTFDFNSEMFSLFDNICQTIQIPVLHPISLGWGGLVVVVSPNGLSLSNIIQRKEQFNELSLLEYFSGYQEFWGNKKDWLNEILKRYREKKPDSSTTNLSIANWLLGSMCTHVLFNVNTNRKVKVFPEYYLSSIFDD